MSDKKTIPEINIGTFGHVDHGKTTLVQALSGRRTDAHSEEKKRGITIRLGYADATFYKCAACKEFPYSSNPVCSKCFGKCEPVRTVSFVDAPGHETLMATVLSGTALIDGALLLVDAKEGIKDQTREHLMVLNISGIKKIIIVQNKIDLVTEDEAKKSVEDIRKMVKNTVAENAPIIPVSAQQGINIDALIQAIEENITTPERNPEKEPRFYIARSFDINLPGTEIEKLGGGVLGGSLIQGILKTGDNVEIKPGTMVDGKWKTIKTRIAGIRIASQSIDECHPGGLAGLLTELDPSITKSDSLSGNVLGLEGKLPEIMFEISIKTHLISGEIKKAEAIMLTCGVTRTVGTVTELKKDRASLKLKIPVCAEKGDRVVLSKQSGGVWHLIGYGELI